MQSWRNGIALNPNAMPAEECSYWLLCNLKVSSAVILIPYTPEAWDISSACRISDGHGDIEGGQRWRGRGTIEVEERSRDDGIALGSRVWQSHPFCNIVEDIWLLCHDLSVLLKVSWSGLSLTRSEVETAHNSTNTARESSTRRYPKSYGDIVDRLDVVLGE